MDDTDAPEGREKWKLSKDERINERETSRDQQDRRAALTAAATSMGAGVDSKSVFARAKEYLDWIKQS
jgi:hypothetical protein